MNSNAVANMVKKHNDDVGHTTFFPSVSWFSTQRKGVAPTFADLQQFYGIVTGENHDQRVKLIETFCIYV